MLQRLVVAQVVAPCVLELGEREKEPVMGGPPPQHPPEALDDLELWALTGQAVDSRGGTALSAWAIRAPRCQGALSITSTTRGYGATG